MFLAECGTFGASVIAKKVRKSEKQAKAVGAVDADSRKLALFSQKSPPNDRC